MTQAGPAIPVVVSSQPPDGGPALRVAVVADGRPTEAGPARPVVVVTDNRPTQGNDPVPVVASRGNGFTLAGPPIPVVVVSGYLQSAYVAKVIATSPIAYWPLDELSGTVVNDRSGNGRDGTYAAVTLGAAGVGDGRTAAAFNGTASTANVFSASLASVNIGPAGTIALWAQVAGAGVWSDGVNRRAAHVQVDASNRVLLYKETTNDLRWTYTAGGVSKTVTLATTPLSWFHLAITWSAAGDSVKAYYAGAQTGATQTGLGVWVGSLTQANAGSAAGGAANFWSGQLAHVAIWNRSLSAAEVASLAVV